MLEPIIKETRLGSAEVRNTFRVPKVGTIAGCYVTDGKVTRNAEVRLLRDNVVIYEGRSRRSNDSRMTFRKSRAAMSAVSASRTSMTSRSATSLKQFVTERVMDVGA
jgi:translation initiation factor IF-2